jgi:hypothetical protein
VKFIKTPNTMNKSAKITITCVLILVGLVSTYGLLSGKSSEGSQSTPEQYAILTYYPESQVPYIIGRKGFSAKIFYRDNKVENIELTAEEVKTRPISNVVADLLARLSQEGYTLISTSTVSNVQGNGSSQRITNEIHCFLKKAN